MPILCPRADSFQPHNQLHSSTTSCPRGLPHLIPLAQVEGIKAAACSTVGAGSHQGTLDAKAFPQLCGTEFNLGHPWLLEDLQLLLKRCGVGTGGGRMEESQGGVKALGAGVTAWIHWGVIPPQIQKGRSCPEQGPS